MASISPGPAKARASRQLYVIPARCTACRSCELACAIAHSESRSLYGAITETPAPRRRIFVEHVDGAPVPVACRHCDEALCLNACIAGAISRDERGYVSIDASRCVGCNSCIMLCPFGVIQKDDTRHVAQKCDLCPDLATPACVASCPTRAIRYEAATAFSGERRQAAARAGAGGEG